MFYIIENFILNAMKLPGNYCRELPRIVSRELHLDIRQLTHCEILSSSIDSRRGTPKIILKLLLETGQILPKLSPASPEEIAAWKKEYAELLERSGYRKCAAKEISAGSECAYNTNLFYAYQNEDANVFIFWDAANRTAFVTVEPFGALPALAGRDTLAETLYIIATLQRR